MQKITYEKLYSRQETFRYYLKTYFLTIKFFNYEKENFHFSIVSFLTFTVGTSFLAAKFFGADTKLGQCMYMGGGQWQAPVLERTYVFWIPVSDWEANGDWVSCNP